MYGNKKAVLLLENPVGRNEVKSAEQVTKLAQDIFGIPQAEISSNNIRGGMTVSVRNKSGSMMTQNDASKKSSSPCSCKFVNIESKNGSGTLLLENPCGKPTLQFAESALSGIFGSHVLFEDENRKKKVNNNQLHQYNGKTLYL